MAASAGTKLANSSSTLTSSLLARSFRRLGHLEPNDEFDRETDTRQMGTLARVVLSQLFHHAAGIAAPVWWKHLKRNRFRIGMKQLARAALISISSPVNSLFAKKDEKVFGEAISQTTIIPPVFLLGHWRSGTTLLQRYFAMDSRFSYPNFYQCVFPRGFLHSQEKNMKKWEGMLPRTRIFDQMDNDFASAAEDEFALCSLTGYSPYMGWSFPQQWDHYYRYLTFRTVPASELHEWKESFLYFVKKIQYHTGKRVVLKSPPHTCRIKLLLELFPARSSFTSVAIRFQSFRRPRRCSRRFSRARSFSRTIRRCSTTGLSMFIARFTTPTLTR